MAVKKGRGRIKERGTGTRPRRKIILFATEGTNKTETLYFRNFRTENTQIIFTKGNDTDPEKMMEQLLREAEEMNLGSEPGDRAYSLVDADVNLQKDTQIALADDLAQGTIATQIISNPCFEIWYLCHYEYSTRQYYSSDEAVAALRKREPTYTKEKPDMFELTITNLDRACKNAERLEQHNLSVGRRLHASDFQPSTEVYKVIGQCLSHER